MADFAIRWNDFRGGDWGRLDSSRADSNQFTGRNVQVYKSGLVGPRAGWKQIEVTGLPVHNVADGPMGFDVFNDDLIVSIGRLYGFPMTNPAAATAYNAYPAPATTPVSFVRGDGVLYSVKDGVLYKHVGITTAAISTPAPLSFVVRWGLFMVGVDRDTPWRIWFSTVDAGGPDFDTWGVNDFLFVGNTDAITSLNAIYNTLFVGKASGWWAVSGVLGNLASIREIVIGNGPIDHRYTSVTTDNRVVYWPVESVPAWFNGDRVYLDDTQRLAPRDLPFQSQTVIVTPTARSLILCGEDPSTAGTDLLIWKDRAWTRHFTPFDIGAIAPADVTAAAQMPEGVLYAMERGGVGEAPVVLSWDYDLDRPSHDDDAWSSPIDYNDVDLVPATLSLPAWFDGQGRVVRVRSVIVQFRKFPSGVADTLNQMRCAVDALGPYEGGINTIEPLGWSEPSSKAEPDGSPDSWRANFGDQGWANGFQVTFPVLRGVAIQEVVALVDVRKERV